LPVERWSDANRWDTRSGNHAYLDCESDIILTDAEALEALGWT